MNQTWNLEQLRNHIETREKKQQLLDFVCSVDRNIEIFQYHLLTANQSLKPFFPANRMATAEHFDLILGISNHNDEFAHAKLVNEANTIAAIYTVKSLYDHFAQLINGLLLNNLISIYDCSISKVVEKLKLKIEHADIAHCLSELMANKGFQYIDAFANVSKHRYLVKQVLTISTVENKSGVRFEAFKYRKKDYPSMWSNEVLESIMDTQNIIIDAGVCLNRLCCK